MELSHSCQQIDKLWSTVPAAERVSEVDPSSPKVDHSKRPVAAVDVEGRKHAATRSPLQRIVQQVHPLFLARVHDHLPRAHDHVRPLAACWWAYLGVPADEQFDDVSNHTATQPAVFHATSDAAELVGSEVVQWRLPLQDGITLTIRRQAAILSVLGACCQVGVLGELDQPLQL